MGIKKFPNSGLYQINIQSAYSKIPRIPFVKIMPEDLPEKRKNRVEWCKNLRFEVP